MLPVLRDGAADFRAEKYLGLAVGANRPAGFRRRAFDHLLHREVMAVAEPHAERDTMAGAAGALADILLPERCRRHVRRSRRRRWRMVVIRRRRRPLVALAAKQKIEQPFGMGHARHCHR